MFSQVAILNRDIFSIRFSKHQRSGFPRNFSAVPAQAGKTPRYFLGSSFAPQTVSSQYLYRSIATAMTPDQQRTERVIDLRPITDAP